MKYKIFDLDGCLSDDRHRLDLLPKGRNPKVEDYDEYHYQLVLDPAINRELLQDTILEQRRDPFVKPLFVTSRPEKFRKHTVNWLSVMFGQFDYALLMRSDDDQSPAAQLKVDLLNRFGVTPENILIAYDDQQSVLAAYQEWGLENCKLVQP